MPSIFSRMVDSSYGAINYVIQSIFPNAKIEVSFPSSTGEDDEENESLNEVLKLPRIVVIGEETSGKSTLLQNITCKKIFPEGFKQTTRFPIRLILQAGVASVEVTWKGETKSFTNDAEIIAHIRSAIGQLPLHTVSSEEMIVKITGEKLPNIELIDLPGLSFSPTKDAVSEMISSYCQDENTLVLLVVAATTTSLITNHAVDKVTSLGKRHKSVLCLTMCDNVPTTFTEDDDEAVKEQKLERMNLHIVDRIMMNNVITDDVRSHVNPRTPGEKFGELNVMSQDSVKFTPFHSCVAVAHLNNSTGAAEQKYFNGVLDNLGPTIADFSDDLKKHFTCAAVLRELDGLYHNHMKTVWCPKVIDRLDTLIAADDAELAALGTNPTGLFPRQVWMHIVSKLDKKAMVESIKALVNNQFYISNGFSGTEELSGVSAGSFEDLQDFCLLDSSITEALAALSRERLALAVFAHFEAIFKKQEDKSFMINRFEFLAEKIKRKLTALFNAEKYVKRDNERIAFAAQTCRVVPQNSTVVLEWEHLEYQVSRYLSATALNVLDDLTTEFDLNTPEDDGLPLLRERKDVAVARSKLEIHLKLLHKHREDMEGFDTFLNTGL